MLRRQGYNVEGIFDAEIPTATVRKRKQREKEQVEALVAKRQAFLASAIFQTIGTMCVTNRAVTKAQRIQLEQESEKAKERIEKRAQAKEKQLLSAQEVNEKRLRGEKLLVADLKAVLSYVLFVSGSKETISKFKNKAMVEEKLSSFQKSWWDYVPLCSVTEQQQTSSQEKGHHKESSTEQQLNEAQLLLSFSDNDNSAEVSNIAPVSL